MVIYLDEEDRYFVINDDWLGLFGFLYTRGYIGSAIFTEVYWSSLHAETLRSYIKRIVASTHTISIDSENFMQWDYKGIRSEMEEFGMKYDIYDIVPPSFLYTGPKNQFLSFLKGFILGSLSFESHNAYAETGIYTIDFQAETLYNEMIKLLTQFEVSFISDINRFKVSITDEQLLLWALNQETDFKWT